MKHLKYLFALLLSCMLLVSMAGCVDREFENAAKQTTAVKYIGVDNDLNLVSNYIEKCDLKLSGLKSNAYFLYGTESTLYFAVTNTDTMKESTVYDYDIGTGQVTVLFSKSGNADQGAGKMYLFYVAMAKEDTVTCFYSYKKAEMFHTEYYIRAVDYTLEGSEISSNEYSTNTVFASFNNSSARRELIQFDFMTGKSDCYWSKRTNSYDFPVKWIYSFEGTSGSYDIKSMQSADAMWNLVHSTRDGAAGLYGEGEGIYYQPYRGSGAFGLFYCDSANKTRYVYFNYTEGGEPEYLFTGNGKPLLGLYVIK